MEKKPTKIGKVVSERIEKGLSVVEPEAEKSGNEERYVKRFVNAHTIGKAMFSGSFYIEIQTKRERVLKDVLHRYFIPKEACPRPTYDQTLFRYDSKLDGVTLVWALPDKQTCILALIAPTKLEDLKPGEKEMVEDIRRFADNSLMHLCTHLNSLIKESTYRDTFKASDFENMDNLIIQS